MDQVVEAFNGRYREVNRETQQWYTYNHPVPEPRPGMVSTCPLPPAGEKTDCFLSNKSAAQLRLIFASILQHAPSLMLKMIFIHLLCLIFIIWSSCHGRISKKLINHCHAALDLSICVGDSNVYLPSVSRTKPGSKIYPPRSACLTRCWISSKTTSWWTASSAARPSCWSETLTTRRLPSIESRQEVRCIMCSSSAQVNPSIPIITHNQILSWSVCQ